MTSKSLLGESRQCERYSDVDLTFRALIKHNGHVRAESLPMPLIELFRPEDATVGLAAGEFLFKEGDASDCAYVLVGGTCEIIVNRRVASGFEKIVTKQVVETAGYGSLVGEMALVEDLPRSASVRAVTDCRFVSVDREHFERLVQKNPHFAIQVMQTLAERLRNMNQIVTG